MTTIRMTLHISMSKLFLVGVYRNFNLLKPCDLLVSLSLGGVFKVILLGFAFINNPWV